MNRVALSIVFLHIVSLTVDQSSYSCSAESSCSSTPNSQEACTKKVEKKDILAKIIKAISTKNNAKHKNQCLRATERLLDEACGTQTRHVLNAAGKNMGGQVFPLDPEVFLNVLKPL